MTTKQRAQLYHELGKLIGAGLHMDRSIELLLDQRPAGAVRAWLVGLRRGLAEHLPVAESIAKYTEATLLEVSLLAAGERGGRLEASCGHLARYYELRQKSKDKAMGALIYPLILFHLGLIFPDIPKLVLGGGTSEIVSGMIVRLGIAWAGLAAVAFVAWSAIKAGSASSLMDGLLNALPLVGSVRKHWALARFCQVFHTGLLASFRISETLQLAGDASQSALLRAAARRSASAVDKGGSLATSIRKSGAFPRAFMQSVATSEETGTLDREMARWALIEAESAAHAQDRVAEWVPRIFYVLVVLYVASRVVSMFTGYFGQIEDMLDAS